MAPSPPALRRFESLDHWRGLACLLVIIYHSTIVYLVTNPAHAGTVHALLELTHHFNVGVALFFVISGYCIAAAADNSRVRRDRIGTYFVRRFRRIYPPYWILSVARSRCSSCSTTVGARRSFPASPWPQYRPNWYSPTQWFGNLTLIETWRHHVFGSIRGHFIGQAWTLCYEEQFYFVTGMVLLRVAPLVLPWHRGVSRGDGAVAVWARMVPHRRLLLRWFVAAVRGRRRRLLPVAVCDRRASRRSRRAAADRRPAEPLALGADLWRDHRLRVRGGAPDGSTDSIGR